MDQGYKKVCKVSDLYESRGKRFLINDVDIAIFKINGKVFAVSNTCPHQHTQSIYDGIVEDGCVVCPAHGWMFNLKTGKQPTGARGLDSYLVKIIDDEVFVLVKAKEFKW